MHEKSDSLGDLWRLYVEKEGRVRVIIFENDHIWKDHWLILWGRWTQDEIYDLEELHPIKEPSRQLRMAIRHESNC